MESQAKPLSLKQALSSLRWRHRSGSGCCPENWLFWTIPISKSSPTTVNLIPKEYLMVNEEPLTSGSSKPVSRTILLKLGGSQIFAASAASQKVAQMATLCAYSQEPVLNIDYTSESPRELLKQQRS